VLKITKNIVEYANIGTVKYIFNRKARNFTIRINPQGDIRVTIPRFGSVRQAEAFFLGKKDWVEKKLFEITLNNADMLVLREGGEIIVRGRHIVLHSGTNGKDLESAFWKILLEEAGQILPGRVKEISENHGLPYERLRIRKMKSRWGSCSSTNSIGLNSWLILLPDHIVDYVILHELAHTIHKNHSRDFWVLLQKLTNGRAKLLRRELRNYRIAYRLGNNT